MRIKLVLSLVVERSKPELSSAPETFESQGSLVETSSQPRYIGFAPTDHTGKVID